MLIPIPFALYIISLIYMFVNIFYKYFLPLSDLILVLLDFFYSTTIFN